MPPVCRLTLRLLGCRSACDVDGDGSECAAGEACVNGGRFGLDHDFVTETDETQPCTHNPSGVKGCGESGTIGAPAAVTSAMIDALAGIGVYGVEMPFLPMKVWRAIQQKNKTAA